MLLRSISLKHVAGSEKAVVLSLEPTVSRLSLDAPSAAALPAVLMTLLYPEEVSATEIARVAGTRADSAWRLEGEQDGRVFRVSRSFSQASIVLEDRAVDGAWIRAAEGSSAVRVALTELLKLPPPTITEGLNFWVNTSAPGLVAADEAHASTVLLKGSQDVELIATDDYFGNLLGGGGAAAPVVLGDDERALIAEEYRRVRTLEFVEDQLRDAEARLDEVISEAAGMADNTGELGRVNREIAALPQLPALSTEDRALFESSDTKPLEFDRKLAAIDSDTDGQPNEDRRLLGDTGFLGGALTSAMLTVASVALDGGFRRLALLNVVTLAFVLRAFLRHLRMAESSSRGELRVAARERRREQVLAEQAAFNAALEELRARVPVGSLDEYDRVTRRRSELEARAEQMSLAHEAVFASEAYQKVAARRDRAQELVEALRDARRRCGDPGVPAFELADRLTRGGIDPNVVLWRPESPQVDLVKQVKRLGQVASKYRLMSETGLNPKTIASWARVAERIAGEGLPELNLTPEHQLVGVDGAPVWERLSTPQAVTVVQALRMSLHLTLVKARATGIQPFLIDVFPDRVADPAVRARLVKMYTGLGERLQVIVATTH